MRAVKAKNTRPELLVRQVAHALGYRFRLHRRDLPGKPDLIFPRLRKAIFVHGCFWHRHPNCPRATLPKTNKEFWQHKLESNARRDAEQICALRQSGWDTMIIWQCETKDRAALTTRIWGFLKSS
jgi:DNA mismatch endonuclease, patch repair protein